MKIYIVICVFCALVVICNWIYQGEKQIRKNEKDK